MKWDTATWCRASALDYSLDQKTVVRTGFGMTTDPDSYRVIRDAYPGSITVSYSGSGTGTVAVDPANSNASHDSHLWHSEDRLSSFCLGICLSADRGEHPDRAARTTTAATS